MMENVLPTPRPGHQWTMQIFPHGRRVIVQAKPYKLSTMDEAIAKLNAGHRVYVRLEDAARIGRQAKQAKAAA